MKASLRTASKHWLSRVIPDSTRLQILVWLPKLETWRRSRVESYHVAEDREHMYAWLNVEILRNRPIDYLEFGVYQGDSIRRWCDLNDQPASRFWGFDTFTGLPDAWSNFTGTKGRGYFDTGGVLPTIDDRRVSFVKGMFQETLVTFLDSFASSGDLVIHIDSDIYASALYVLTVLHPVLRPGTIIIFDEFSSVMQEFRALEDYCAAYLRAYEVLAAVLSDADYYSQVTIRMTR